MIDLNQLTVFLKFNIKHNIKGMYISAENETSFRPIDENTIFVGGEGHKTGDNSFKIEDVYANIVCTFGNFSVMIN